MRVGLDNEEVSRNDDEWMREKVTYQLIYQFFEVFGKKFIKFVDYWKTKGESRQQVVLTQ